MTKLEDQIKQYHDLAQKDKSIDVATLMMTALDTAKGNYIPIKQKRWAYLLSLSVPLVGFYYCFKYFNSNTEDGLETSLICAILACLCLVSLWLLPAILSSSLSGSQATDIKNLKPEDVYQLTQ